MLRQLLLVSRGPRHRFDGMELRANMLSECGMTNFNGGVWDRNTLAEAGFAHFDRGDGSFKNS